MRKELDELYLKFYHAKLQEMHDQIYGEVYEKALRATGDPAEAHLQALDAIKCLPDDEAVDYAKEMVRENLER